MRKALAVLMLLWLALPAAGLSLEVGEESYTKGEALEVSGECSGHVVQVSAFKGEKEVFREEAECRQGRFQLSHSIGFLEPRGNWVLRVEEGEEAEEAGVLVKPSRESSLILLTFLHPLEKKVGRASDLNIVARATYAGNPLEGARVETWNAFGERVAMEGRGNGVYSLKQRIPFNAPLGGWQAGVVASAMAGEEEAGGENTLQLEVEKAEINMKFLQPASKSFAFGQAVPVKVKAVYADGSPLQGGTGTVSGEEGKKEMERNGSIFTASHQPGESETGAFTLVVRVEDAAGNAEEEELNLVAGEGMLFALQRGWVYLAIIIVVAAFAVFFLYPKTRARAKRQGLEMKRKELLEKVKELQQEYFDKGTLTQEQYEEKQAGLEERLNELNEKVKSR